MSCAGSSEEALSNLVDNCCTSIAVTMPTKNPFDSSDEEEAAPKEARQTNPEERSTVASSPNNNTKKELPSSSPAASPKAAASPKKAVPSPAKTSPRKSNTNPFLSEDEEDEAEPNKTKKLKKKKSKKKTFKKSARKATAALSSSDDEEEKKEQQHIMTAHEAALLEDELANLDLDADFLASSASMPEPQESEEPMPSDEFWAERLERDEVFSHRYKPGAVEKQELQALQAQLGGILDGSSDAAALWRGIFGTTNNNNNTSGVSADSQQAVKELFVALENSLLAGLADMATASSSSKPSSIILKRGTVQWGGAVTMEVVLMTHGMLLIQLQEQTNLLGRKSVKRSLQQAVLWDAVSYCGPLSSSTDSSWQVVPKDGASWEFQCSNATQQTAWLQAMERVLVQYCMHSRSAATLELGWQYKLIHKPAFTLAVQGKGENGLAVPHGDVINRLDEYNEYAPLHVRDQKFECGFFFMRMHTSSFLLFFLFLQYAVRLNKLDAARCLLERAGADVNVKDGEGCTPMYYALRDEVSEEMITLLEKHGANKNNERRAKEELFGRVKATEAKVAAKKQQREEQERQKAEAAQAQMAENMRLMNERGQKIEEIGDKASHLNYEAQNYADMARQLKEKSKKRSKWLPF